MGFLHEGHLSLMRRARGECGAVTATIFVNPTQFGPERATLARYPRDLARDLGAAGRRRGSELVFTPAPAEMYPEGLRQPRSSVERRSPRGWRAPRGRATSRAWRRWWPKLFNIVQPTRAYFGQKDAQQAAVVQPAWRRDLDLPAQVAVAADGAGGGRPGACPAATVYLAPAERAAAPVLHRALRRAQALFAAGESDADVLRASVREVIAAEPQVGIDYVSVADPATLLELDRVDGAALVSLAARLGRTRLIDNVLLERVTA